MMTFCYLDYILKIPAKPPKLASNRVARGPENFGGQFLKIAEYDFPHFLDFGGRPQPLSACQIWSKTNR